MVSRTTPPGRIGVSNKNVQPAEGIEIPTTVVAQILSEVVIEAVTSHRSDDRANPGFVRRNGTLTLCDHRLCPPLLDLAADISINFCGLF